MATATQTATEKPAAKPAAKKDITQPKVLPAPDSDFYDLYETLTYRTRRCLGFMTSEYEANQWSSIR